MNYANEDPYPGQITSLSHSDDEIRLLPVKAVIRCCAEAGFRGLILGFAQGNDTRERTLTGELFERSLELVYLRRVQYP